MKKYLSQLRPMERRLVVGVGVVLLVVLNWMFIWPHFSDFGSYRDRLGGAEVKLRNYRTAVAQIPELQKQLKVYESEGEFVAPEDQGVNSMRTIQQQAAQSGVALQNASRSMTKTNDVFFVEQIQNINVLAPEENLVDFLYKLGSGSSMIRVRDLSLQPDPPHQRLVADIRLVASYQKNPTTAPAAKASNAKAK
jgi:type II secretory pathway component PulM